jgi:hypothetical protein
MTTPPPDPRLPGLLERLGTLRVLLLTGAVLVIVAAPFADGTVHMHDWRLLPTVVAPSLMMMLVFALPLDMTMARVFMADAGPAERARLGFVIRLEAAFYIAMLAAWAPFLIGVLEISPFS